MHVTLKSTMLNFTELRGINATKSSQDWDIFHNNYDYIGAQGKKLLNTSSKEGIFDQDSLLCPVDAVVDTVTGPSTQVTTNYIGTTGEPMAWITQQNSTDLKELQSRGAMEPKIGSVWFRSRKRLSPPLLFALRVACERPGRSRALLAKIACWRGQRRGTRVDVDSSGSCRVRVGFMPSFVVLPGGKL